LVAARAAGEIVDLQRPSPSMVVIPRQTESFQVEAVAGGGASFAAGATVALHVEVKATGDTVQVPPVDVGGVPRRVVLSVAASADRYAFSAPPPEVAVGSPAAEARAAAREVLGGIDRVPDAEALRIVIAVDGSASMRRLVASGAVAEAVRLLTGISLVLGGSSRRPARYVLVDQGLTAWEFDQANPDAPVQALTAALSQRPPLIGVDLGSAGLRAPDRQVETNLAYLVTDGVPGAIDRIASEGRVPGELRHLVVLQPGLEALEPLPVPATKLRVPDPGVGSLLGDYQSVLDACRSLLRGSFAPGSALASRLEGR
jgi:hypothetical protein